MDTKVKPMLFYQQSNDIRDCRFKIFLENVFETEIETYPVIDHRAMYDHKDIPEYFPDSDIKMSDSCWCNIPDENISWPQLYFQTINGYEFIAAAEDILNVDTESLLIKYGRHFIGSGQCI